MNHRGAHNSFLDSSKSDSNHNEGWVLDYPKHVSAVCSQAEEGYDARQEVVCILRWNVTLIHRLDSQ